MWIHQFGNLSTALQLKVKMQFLKATAGELELCTKGVSAQGLTSRSGVGMSSAAQKRGPCAGLCWGQPCMSPLGLG